MEPAMPLPWIQYKHKRVGVGGHPATLTAGLGEGPVEVEELFCYCPKRGKQQIIKIFSGVPFNDAIFVYLKLMSRKVICI